MAKFRSIGKIEKPGYVGCSGVFLLLVANFQVVGELLQFKLRLIDTYCGAMPITHSFTQSFIHSVYFAFLLNPRTAEEKNPTLGRKPRQAKSSLFLR